MFLPYVSLLETFFPQTPGRAWQDITFLVSYWHTQKLLVLSLRLLLHRPTTGSRTMADEGAPYDSFRKAYNGAVEHYERGHRDDYIAKCRVTLSRPNIPRGIWLRTIILLGTVFPHRETRHEIHAVAESYWRALRRSSPIGRDVEVDTILQETRKSLDELQVTIAQEREVALVAESSDGGNDLEEGIVASQTVDKEKAEDTDTEELTLEEMIAVKPRQFDMVIEELRKLDTSELNVMVCGASVE